jgi:predicted anti-sigma-YlaC factor YlaD
MSAHVDDLNCQELVELVTDYLEGALPERERARFDEHLGICEGCAHYLDQIRLTARLAGRAGEELERLPGMDHLLEAFRDWKRGGAPA